MRTVMGLLYQKLHNPGSGNRWQTHLEISHSEQAFATFKDIILADIPDDNGTGPTLNPTNPLGDYAGLLAVGETFYGVFCGNNTPDLANFPHGVFYQRNHNFTTHQLLDLSGNPVIASYDPFFFKVSHREEKEEEGKELRGVDFARLEVEGLKYERLEIKELRLDLVDPRREREEERREHHHEEHLEHKEHHHDRKRLAIRRLGEEIEDLGKRLVSLSEEEDHKK